MEELAKEATAMTQDRKIGDTGLTVEAMRDGAVRMEKGYAFASTFVPTADVILSLLDALEAAWKENAECEASHDALCEKIKTLSAHHTCGCSYDTPEDVCMHHSPALVKAEARAEALAKENEALRAAMSMTIKESVLADDRSMAQLYEDEGNTDANGLITLLAFYDRCKAALKGAKP